MSLRDLDPVDLDNWITGHYGADQFDEDADAEWAVSLLPHID